MRAANWRGALLHLHGQGWDAGDIDAAWDALNEACTEGAYEGEEIEDLTTTQVGWVLGGQTDSDECESFHQVAKALSRDDLAEVVRRALDDLDHFVLQAEARSSE